MHDELHDKNVISWIVTIQGYARYNHAEGAMEMRHEGVQPNEVTYLSILKAFGSPSALILGREVHARTRHDDFESDLRVGSALVHMYAKTGYIDNWWTCKPDAFHVQFVHDD